MKQFINIFGVTSILEVSYINAYNVKENAIRHAVRASRVSIKEHPGIVEEKSWVGGWEIDLVIGKEHSGALVIIVGRVTSFTVSKRVSSKSADVVAAATIALLTPHTVALIITADNKKVKPGPVKFAQNCTNPSYSLHTSHLS